MKQDSKARLKNRNRPTYKLRRWLHFKMRHFTVNQKCLTLLKMGLGHYVTTLLSFFRHCKYRSGKTFSQISRRQELYIHAHLPTPGASVQGTNSTALGCGPQSCKHTIVLKGSQRHEDRVGWDRLRQGRVFGTKEQHRWRWEEREGRDLFSARQFNQSNLDELKTNETSWWRHG